MGYLADTWRGHDAVLIASGAPSGRRASMRIAFYLGVKAMLDTTEQADKMERAEFSQFTGEIISEFHDFEVEMTEAAIDIIREHFAQIGGAK